MWIGLQVSLFRGSPQFSSLFSPVSYQPSMILITWGNPRPDEFRSALHRNLCSRKKAADSEMAKSKRARNKERKQHLECRAETGGRFQNLCYERAGSWTELWKHEKIFQKWFQINQKQFKNIVRSDYIQFKETKFKQSLLRGFFSYYYFTRKIPLGRKTSKGVVATRQQQLHISVIHN